jgi:threonine/homoserine/homoserine lactone efflux protein
MSFDTLALFSLACLMLAITPGPDMIYVLSRSIAQGPLAGLVSVAGFALGITFHALAAAFGLAKLFETSPLAYDLLQYAGAAYLAWMAYQTFRSPELPFLTNAKAPKAALWLVFRQACIGNLLNPKVILFFIALFPQFLHQDEGSLLGQTLILVLILNIIGSAVNGSIALLGGRFGAFMSARPRFRKVQKYLLATVFAGLALRLAVGRSN